MYKEILLDYKELYPYISKENLDIHLSIYRKNLNKLNNLLNDINYDYRYSMIELITNIDIFNLNIRGEILYYLLSEFYQDDLILVGDKHIDLILGRIEKAKNNDKPNIVNQNKIETYDVENIENEINIKKKVDSQYSEWRKKLGYKIRGIYNRKICYIESKEIIREIYRDMTIRYGIVWEQEYKEWKRDHVKNPTTMEIIYYNENYKSIFESILDDMFTKAINDKYEELTLSEIAQPLVVKDKDTSKGGSTTLRKIYKDMETRCNINWEKRARKYAKIAEIPVENVTKRSIVCSESGILENFRISMYSLLNQ